MTSFRRHLWFAGSLVFALSSSGIARAHNEPVHQKIVNLAWQVMRAANRDGLANMIKWDQGRPPTGFPDLSVPGNCTLPATDPLNLCGETVTLDQWSAYLNNIRVSRQHLNAEKTELTTSGTGNNDGAIPLDSNCATQPDVFVSLADYAGKVGTDYLPGIELSTSIPDADTGLLSCQLTGVPRSGIFDEFTIPDDGLGNQGLVLGWHAQHRDDEQADTQIDLTAEGVAQITRVVSDAVQDFGAGAILPFVALYELFAGDFFGSVRRSEKLAGHVNVVDYIYGILPGSRDNVASTNGRTVWHFINVRTDDNNGGVSNFDDDNQGLFYEEAGPRGELSGLDHALVIAGDVFALTLDASNSAGTERYEITDDETDLGHGSSNRTDIGWQSQNIGHLPFSPLDNFAMFGDSDFPHDGRPGGITSGHPRQMGWPLHAIADASVPAHVVGTTGWGHKPLEGFCQNSWPVLMFEPPPLGCPVATSSDAGPPNSCTADSQRLAQAQQAERILERGFRWRQYLATHPDIRDFITQIAKDTLALAGQNEDDLDVPSGHIPGLWCDSCSAGQQDGAAFPQPEVVNSYTNILDQEAFADNEGYYAGTLPEFQGAAKQSHHDRIFAPTRQLLEQAVGATVGYLVSRGSSATESCNATGNLCPSLGIPCCEGSRCQSTQGPTGTRTACCAEGGSGCFNSDDCCSGTCVNNICQPGLHDACSAMNACTQGQCVNSKCCEEGAVQCSVPGDCCSNRCAAGTCVAVVGGSCNSNKECASSFCTSSGVCCAQVGAVCNSVADCCGSARSTCTDGTCRPAPSLCGNGIQACTQDSDCPTAGDTCSSGCCVGAPK